MNDIVCAGRVKRLVAGVQVIPHAIFTEQLIKLSAGQFLCIFAYLYCSAQNIMNFPSFVML